MFLSRFRSRSRGQSPSRAIELALVGAGTALVALSFNLLFRPNQVAPGGLPGISLLLERACGVAPAVSQIVINLVFLGLGWRLLGREFFARTALGSLLLPAFVWLSSGLPALTHNLILAVVCGGVGTGVGVGLVFRGRGSVGGFSTLAQIFHRRFGITVDRTLLACDGTVVALAALVFPADAVLGALIAVFLVARSARSVLTGFSNAHCAYIITRHPDPIAEVVLRELDLGLTRLSAHGGYTDEEHGMLMVVMRPADVPRLKATVRRFDPKAFVVMVEASEVLGYGFDPMH